MAQQHTSQGKVLILDADSDRAKDLCDRLSFLNYEPVFPSGKADAVAVESIAVLVGDTDPELGCAVESLRDSQPHLPCLYLNESLAQDDRKNGGISWLLERPLRKSQLQHLLKRAQRYQQIERRHRLTGTSASIRRVRSLIEDVADFDTNVLITGQSGTGKELVARTIHDLSERSDKPFVPINCGAIPPDLLESELFGHDKGAFTGAVSNRTGRFELADGGTLFLDEIGDMSMPMQVKLLRVLQERTFERVGSNKTRRCNVRIVAATHKDLPQAVKDGKFREDLFYRLNVFPIEMPPLFKRASDLPQLMKELLVQHTGEQAGSLRVSKEALSTLAGYDWPGNIRELSNLVERLAILKPTGVINVDDLPPKYREAVPNAGEKEATCVAEAMQMTADNLKDHLQCIEQQLITEAMQTCNQVAAQAAKLLNMRRTTLVEKLRKLDIH